MSKVIQALNHVDQVRSIKYSDAPHKKSLSLYTPLPEEEASERSQIPPVFIFLMGFMVLIGISSLILNMRALTLSRDSQAVLAATLSKLDDQQKKLQALEKAMTGTQGELGNQVKAMRSDMAQTGKNLTADIAKINKNVIDNQAAIGILQESSEQSKTQIKNLDWFRQKMAEKYSELSQDIKTLKSLPTKGQ